MFLFTKVPFNNMCIEYPTMVVYNKYIHTTIFKINIVEI